MTSDARPTVSVALCTRNGALYVAEQLASILGQTVPVDEIVVSDDDSSDATLAIIEQTMAASDAAVPLIVLTHRPPLGVTQNFQTAIAATHGDIVFLSDQDDIWEPTKVAAVLGAMQDPSVGLVASDAILIDGNGEDLGETLLGRLGATASERATLTGSEGWRALLSRNLVTGATVAVRRSVVDAGTPFPSAWLHDEWLAMVAAARGTVALVESPLIRYRIHSNNVVGMRRRTASVMWSTLTAPGAERNATLAARARQLVDRLELMGPAAPEALRADARAKLAYELRRCGLSHRRWRRVVPVLRGAATGDYVRFGGGNRDVLRDLVQPLDDTQNHDGTHVNGYPSGNLHPESDG